MIRFYYLSSSFIESGQDCKVSGCSLFLWLLVLLPEISLAPLAIPRAIHQDTTSSKLHILYYNSFSRLEFKARLLNPESCNDLLSSLCKPSLGYITPHKMEVSPIRYMTTNFRLPQYIKIKQFSHGHGVNSRLGIKTPQPRALCKPSFGIKHHDLFLSSNT